MVMVKEDNWHFQVAVNRQFQAMLFQDEVPEDKGLFTFYREQADRQDELKRQKKLRKKRREEQAEEEALNPSPPKELPTQRKADTTRHYLLPKTINTPREPLPNSKPRLTLPKQRLLESIVDMGKDIEPDADYSERHLVTLRQREPSHILKSRRYRQREEGGEERGAGVEEMLIESLHRRNQSEELYPQAKQAIHSVRGSAVELPDIRKSEERLPYRPKKSLKSKLIQDALLSRDRDKIRQIRTYLKAQSPPREGEAQAEAAAEEERGYEVFEFRQQKLLAVLKRFRRG